MAIQRFTINFNELIDPGSICQSPNISWGLAQNILIPCYDDDSLDIEINTDNDGPFCLTFVIECSNSCSTCGPISVKKCFCVNPDDCENCSNCEGNLCVSRCETGKICDNDTCVDCSDSVPCFCNQECSQGVCRCPANKPIKRADGCCVECLDGEDLGNCLICYNGVIVAVDCPNGYCDPTDGNCQECLNNSHCTGVNECCDAEGRCSCCPGYVLDPATGECTPSTCTDAQYCIDHFGPCYYCTEDGCETINCPAGQICDPATGDCVPSCDDGVCPDGYGCLNGRCVPCNTLSCDGTGPQCQFADGCECNGSVCEWVDCDVDNVELEWVTTPSVPGIVTSPGQPAVLGSTVITPTGIVYLQPPAGAAYQNHSFTLTATNATSGTWTLYNTPNQSVSLGSGTSVNFDLTDTNLGLGPNLVGFIVKFVESGTGRTATWAIWREPTAPLINANVWHADFTSTGTPPQTSGSTPGSIQLCATNGNFIPIGVTNVVTTGTIVVTLFPTGGNCMTAHISGCGTWNGDILLRCGGKTVTVPADSITRDPANCCDPTDPNCDGWGTGEPCGDLTIQNITLTALPTFGSSGSGDGEFVIIADWTSAGLSFLDLFYLDPADSCWSTANNPAASSNDVAIVTNSSQSPFGPSVSNLSVVATLGDGGCVRLGHTCELKIAGCKKLQGEVCMTECSVFAVNIVETGTNTYTAVPSLNDEPVNYTWTYPGLANNTGQTITITPVGGLQSLCVTARYGTPVKCTAVKCLSINTVASGCTNTSACNYNSAATTDDGSCVLIGDPTYDCSLGGFQPGIVTALAENTPIVTWRVNGVFVTTNDPITPGTHTVGIFLNGVEKCSRTLVVPQCYRCSAGDCVTAPIGANSGPYTTIDCGGVCDCNIEVNITQSACSNNRSSLVITATGDTGTYTGSVTNVATGVQVLAPIAFTSASSITTPSLCRGTYRVLVTGANCSRSKDFFVNCNDCAQNTAALSAVSFDCGTNQLFFTIATDPCTDSYNVRLLNSVPLAVSNTNYTTGGAKTVPLGAYPGDGAYTVRLTANGCTRDYDLLLNCNDTIADCAITSSSAAYSTNGVTVSFTSSFTLDTAGGSYSVGLYSTTGGVAETCTGAQPQALITSQTVTGALGINTVNFTNAVSNPAGRTCYVIIVQKLGAGNETCYTEDFVLVVGGEAPPNCDGEITNLSYDTTTGNVLVSWDFEDTSHDLTVEIRVSATPCDPADPIIVSVDGNGENGVNIPFGPIHQINGVAQCATVTVYDTNDPTCSDSLTIEIPACTCAIEITNTEIDPVAETLLVTYTTRCTSGDATITVTGDATGSGSDSATSTTGVVLEGEKTLALVGYPSTGGNIDIEILDDLDAGCGDTLSVPLEQNCTPCAQIASLFLNDSTLTQIRNHAGAVVVTGSYNVIADEADIEQDTEAEITADGGNFCLDGTPVDVANSRKAGIKVNQDSTDYQSLDHVLIENPAWPGSLKSYFTDCGCGIARRCDYTANLPISATANALVLYFANNNLGGDYSGEVSIAIATPQTFSESALANIENLVLAGLTGSTCNSEVDDVTATYDPGTDILTLVVTGTNAGLSVFHTFEGALVADVVDFTQSNCV